MFSPKDFVPDSLKSCVVYQFHVRAVEFVILVKPIGILTHALIDPMQKWLHFIILLLVFKLALLTTFLRQKL